MSKSLISRIADLQRKYGLPVDLSGYAYVRAAVALLYEDPSAYRRCIITGLYPKVAQMFGTTASAVERCIRQAILVASRNGNELIRAVDTNAKLLYMMVEELLLEDAEAQQRSAKKRR